MVTLRPMTEAEYETFIAELTPAFAAERAQAEDTPLERELEAATKQVANILPQGFRTHGHHFWKVEAEDGADVGVLWVMIDDAQRRAFIYDIEIDEAQRSKGYGAATLRALEEELRPTTVTHIGLNVFGPNTIAHALYNKMGYQVAATYMLKRINEGA